MARKTLKVLDGGKVSKKQVSVQDSMQFLIDEFGRLSEQEKEIKAKKDAIRQKLIETLGEGMHDGFEFRVTISTREDITLNPVKVYKAIGLKNFLQVAKVNVTDAKRFIAQDDLQSMIDERRETYIVSAKRR